jgi:hypothetical protein
MQRLSVVPPVSHKQTIFGNTVSQAKRHWQFAKVSFSSFNQQGPMNKVVAPSGKV